MDNLETTKEAIELAKKEIKEWSDFLDAAKARLDAIMDSLTP